MVICASGQRALGPDTYQQLQLSGRLSLSGHVRPLDEGSDGMVPAEGVAVLLLKRFSDAKADGDNILAVIREIGVARSDDARSAQSRAIQRALKTAKVKPEQVSAVELSAAGVAHEDGDELAVIERTYRFERERPLHVRSLAGQIGHLGGAAGMVSLVKSALSLQYLESPACLPPERPPNALSSNSCCEVPLENRTLPVVCSSGRVFSTLNSYSHGLACHVLLERASRVDNFESKGDPVIESKPMSNVTCDFHTWLYESDSTSDLVQAAGRIAEERSDRVTTTSRSDARQGLAIVYRTAEELRKKAKLFIAQRSHAQRRELFDAQGIYWVERTPVPRVAFLFPGQGSQYPGMLTDLVEEHPVASAAAAEFDAVLKTLDFPAFRNLVVDEAEQLGRDVWRTQLSVLVAESILLEVIKARGVQPNFISAHSFGEFAAMIAAGAWDFCQAAVATFLRCQLITESVQIDGAMMACALNRNDAQRLCDEYAGKAFIANCNTDEQTVIAGTKNAIRNLHVRLGQLGVQATILNVPCPYHTPLMAPLQQPYRDCVMRARIAPPSTPLLSSVDNRFAVEPDVIRENLVRQFVQPVQYPSQIHRLASLGVRVMVEIGPGQVLTRMNQRIVGDDTLLIATDHNKRPYAETLVRLDAALRAAGVLADTRKQLSPATTLAEARHFKQMYESGSNAPVNVLSHDVQTEPTPEPKPGLSVLTVAGSPQAMGAAHGQAMGQAIRRMLDRYAELAEARLGKGLPDVSFAKSRKNRIFDKSAVDELHGMAAAAGVHFESLLEHNLYAHPDLGAGCTQV